MAGGNTKVRKGIKRRGTSQDAAWNGERERRKREKEELRKYNMDAAHRRE